MILSWADHGVERLLFWQQTDKNFKTHKSIDGEYQVVTL